jgi:hypothetical protein
MIIHPLYKRQGQLKGTVPVRDIISVVTGNTPMIIKVLQGRNMI